MSARLGASAHKFCWPRLVPVLPVRFAAVEYTGCLLEGYLSVGFVHFVPARLIFYRDNMRRLFEGWALDLDVGEPDIEVLDRCWSWAAAI